MMWEKLRVVSDEAVKEASEDYRDTFGEDAIAENVAKRFHEIVPPRWLIATMQFPRPEAGEVSKVFFLSALLTSELEPSRWRRSGVNFAKPFMFYLLRGRRREQMDAVRHDNAPKASVAVQLITPKAEDAWRGLNGPLRRPLFAVHGIYAQWHFYASLLYGRDLVPSDWFVAKSYLYAAEQYWSTEAVA